MPSELPKRRLKIGPKTVSSLTMIWLIERKFCVWRFEGAKLGSCWQQMANYDKKSFVCPFFPSKTTFFVPFLQLLTHCVNNFGEKAEELDIVVDWNPVVAFVELRCEFLRQPLNDLLAIPCSCRSVQFLTGYPLPNLPIPQRQGDADDPDGFVLGLLDNGTSVLKKAIELQSVGVSQDDVFHGLSDWTQSLYMTIWKCKNRKMLTIDDPQRQKKVLQAAWKTWSTSARHEVHTLGTHSDLLGKTKDRLS